ncbi:MAG: HAD-IIB family hydrolase [Myxococcota bacterium]
MRPAATLSAELARGLRGLLFDLDDTLLDHGKLVPSALDALYRMKAAGLELFAVTGRPAGWGAVIAHQWPIDGAITENGGLALVHTNGRVTLHDRLAPKERTFRRRELDYLVTTLRSEFPELVPSDDVWQRISDFTFDIGEYQRVPRERVLAVRQRAHALGAATIASSVHLHVSLDRADKASASAQLMSLLYGVDPFRVLSSYAFIGDSENDAACFNAFRVSFGVKNLSGRPTLCPRFITQGERAAGFVEAAELLLARRA